MRPRRDPRSHYRLTMRVLSVALDLDAWEDYWGGPEEGRRAWSALKADLQTNPGTRPAAFWAYEPDVPAELRGTGNVHDDAALEGERRRWLRERAA